MPKITFNCRSGKSVTVHPTDGTLMRAAIQNGVEGIDADCGGVCNCATCHVHIHPEWVDRVGPATDAEKGLLEFEDKANERSRLACQVRISDALDGLVVDVVGR